MATNSIYNTNRRGSGYFQTVLGISKLNILPKSCRYVYGTEDIIGMLK